MKDLPLPKTHPWYNILVYDTEAKSWYNKKSDIYLSDDDVQYYNLPSPETLKP